MAVGWGRDGWRLGRPRQPGTAPGGSRYSAAVPDPEPNEPRSTPDPPIPASRPRPSHARAALPWVLAAAVVLTFAAAGGLLTAYLVANLRAVPPPAALLTPTPTLPATATPSPTATPGATEPTPQPRRTPTAPPTVTPEPTPFVHVVQRGESLTYIANLYGVSVGDILALNNIKNPNRVPVGRELLIPGWAPNRP